MTELRDRQRTSRVRVVQISRRFGTGGGVSAVAQALEHEFDRLQWDHERLDVRSCGISFGDIHRGGRVTTWARLGAEVVVFTVIATLVARKMARANPETIFVCHGDALFGQIYVDHGLLKSVAALKGGSLRFALSNPLAGFVLIRDWIRFHSRIHSVVVSLTPAAQLALKQNYPTFRGSNVLIANGVDALSYAKPVTRDLLRAKLSFAPDNRYVLFVGHEHKRKGLHDLIEAMALLPVNFHLVVVGGNSGMCETSRRHASATGVAERVQFLGPVPDPRELMWGADIFCLPSHYETGPLVLLEALASGLPSVMTPVGLAASLLADGQAGTLVDHTPRSIAEGIMRAEVLRGLNASAIAAERVIAAYDWSRQARLYSALIQQLWERRLENSAAVR